MLVGQHSFVWVFPIQITVSIDVAYQHHSHFTKASETTNIFSRSQFIECKCEGNIVNPHICEINFNYNFKKGRKICCILKEG